MERISIIIPVYNAEKCLERCVNSILNQDYNNLEIVLINNQSTDKSSDICKELSELNDKIVYISINENGVSAARNAGIDIASGKLIGFCDADDYYEQHFLKEVVCKMINADADICIFNINKIYQNGRSSCHSRKADLILDSENFIIRTLVDSDVMGSVWNKIYRKEILNDIRFDTELTLMEDTYFNICIASKHKYIKCLFACEIGYNYVLSSSSVTTKVEKIFNGEKLKYIESIDKIKKNCNLTKKASNALNVTHARLCTSVFEYKDRIKTNPIFENRIKWAKKNFFKKYIYYVLCPYVSVRNKLKFTIIALIS